MELVRHHPGEGSTSDHSGGECSGLGANHGHGRLNLLLSYAGWHPDPWVDRLPPLLEPMGVVSHRAGSGRQASDVIRGMRIHVAVVDLGLPLEPERESSRNDEDRVGSLPEFSEGGARLLEILSRLTEPPPVVAVKRCLTHRHDTREMSAALRWGAFAVVDRPRDGQGLNLMLEVLRRCLEKHYQGRWPGV